MTAKHDKNKFTVVCFKWKKPTNKGAHLLASQMNLDTGYKVDHVNRLYHMVKRNLDMDFQFMCITDEPEESGYHPDIIVKELWDNYLTSGKKGDRLRIRNLGGCYHRMYVFSDAMKDFISDTFVCMDLDCIVTGKLDPLFQPLVDGDIDFCMWRRDKDRFFWYNGSMFGMKAGSRKDIWEKFDPVKTPILVRFGRYKGTNIPLQGTDQAWILMMLGQDENNWTYKDGVYALGTRGVADCVEQVVPGNCRVVFTPGPRDPSETWVQRKYPWINDYYPYDMGLYQPEAEDGPK